MKSIPFFITVAGLYIACIGNQNDLLSLYFFGGFIMISPMIAEFIFRRRRRKRNIRNRINKMNRENTWNFFKNTNLKEKKHEL